MVRQRTLARRRQKKIVLNSTAFSVWWQARRTQKPVPSNPYQAYMTDPRMYAQLRDVDHWRKHTNWSDIGPVDYPTTAHIPRSYGRPRRPRIKDKGRRRRPTRPPRPKAPSVMQRFADKFTEMFHLPSIQVVAIPRGAMKSRYRSFFKFNPNTYTMERFSQAIIGIGETPRENPLEDLQTLTAFKHELGHHMDVFKIWQRTGKINPEYMAQELRGEKVAQERQAWVHAEPLPDPQAVSRWLKRYALATYLHQLKGRAGYRHLGVGVIETKPLGEELKRPKPPQRL